jgi:hypothetical protein
MPALALVALVIFVALASAAPIEATNYANFGPDGTEATDFEWATAIGLDQQAGVVYVLDGYAGTLFKFEADGKPLLFTGTDPSIEGNKIKGLRAYKGENVDLSNREQVAVDPASHRVYVTEEHSIRAFEANGEPAEFTAGPGAGTNEIPDFGLAAGVAVDSNGAIYVSDESGGEVSIYASSGELISAFAFPAGKPGNLAVAPGGAVYVSNYFPGLYKFTPSEFPVTSTVTYEASPVLPNSAGTVSVVVEPLSGDVYVLQGTFSDRGIRHFDKDGNTLGVLARSDGIGELSGQAGGLAVVAGGEEFQLYVGNSKISLEETLFSKVAIFGEEIIEGPPAIRATSAIDVTGDSTMLRAQINPDTATTTYRFQYGTEPCAVSGACAAVGEEQIPAGHRFVSVSEQLLGLEPDTTYHYRVVAENSFDPPTVGPERTFTTQAFGLGFELSDSRTWEMVTPTDKHGATVAAAYPGQILQAAGEGDGIVFPTLGSIDPEVQGSRAIEGSSVLARRSADGSWRNADITPPHTEATIITIPASEYQLFSSDLARGISLPADDTLLSPEASERTIYLRENTDPPVYTPLLTTKEGYANVPPGTEFGSGNGGIRSAAWVLGASEDLSHIVLTADVPLIAGAPNQALYEWHEGQLHPVSKLPAGEGGTWVESSKALGSEMASVHNAVSVDGSRVFWSRGQYRFTQNKLTALYLRNMSTEETVRLDVPQAGASGLGEAHPAFQSASTDGTVVFFTDSQQMTADASPEGFDLYRCEIPAGDSSQGCATLTDLTPAPGPGESTEVMGIVPVVSDDADRAFFFAKGILDSEPNAYGDSAVPGEPNLYHWQKGEGTRFVATLGQKDRRAWGGDADSAVTSNFLGRSLNPMSSPSGRYFAFMSQERLTGEDNLDAATEEPVQQVFVYDAADDQLHCVSCAFSGASPRGRVLPEQSSSRVDPLGKWPHGRLSAILPEPTVTGDAAEFYPLYRPRAVHDNGRVFFNSVDSLVPGDSNGQWDVYEYEPIGTGTCSEESEGAAVVSSDFGCVSLISSGTAEEEAAFLDSSQSGDDVFFTTPAKLSVLDEDTVDDVYDARVDGVVAQRPVVTECLGEACQPAPTPPNDPTPASAAFHGSGNIPSERCPQGKHKVIRAGSPRCVAKKHKQKKRSHKKAKRANPKRRAGR